MKISVEQALAKAKSHEKKGEIGQARAIYERLLRSFPKNKRAQAALGALGKRQRLHAPAVTNPPKEKIDHLISLYSAGRPADVIEEGKALVAQFPLSFGLWNMVGAAHHVLGQLEDAERALRRAIEINPNFSDAHHDLGVALKEQGKLDAAITAFRRALSLNPDFAEAHNNMGNALQKLGKMDQALASYERALALKPDYAEAHMNVGNTLKEDDKLDAALASYARALALKPDFAEVHNNMGNTLQKKGELDAALACYERALALKPGFAEAYNNMGNALKEKGALDEAITSFKRALSAKADYAEAYNNLGTAFQKQGKLDAAITCCERALALKPDYAGAYLNMGASLSEQKKLDEAINAYNKALAFEPDYLSARFSKLNQQAGICDWAEVESHRSCLADLGVSGEPVSPFGLLSLEDAPERHRLRSENYARAKFFSKPNALPARPVKRPKRLRIGYFSADFHNFPGMYLMAGMLEQHDRSKFEIYAFSYGPDANDEMRKRIAGAVDHFVDIRNMPNDVVHECVRQKGIDIAIHRNGYTKNSRTELFADRLAPIQINYLGYPGTLGADFIDYIVADPVIIPEDKREYYSEKIIYLPNTYQPNDNTRMISEKAFTKADMGLPSDGFVFCCFNKNSKISPKEFDIWMRLLDRVDGSVLWLLKSNQWAVTNLKQEAEARGISADRLIFAEKLPQAEHLARQRLADLFLDTFNYNAHTTTSDALWAGLPVVTKLGQGFAARVAGSLLTAVGLPELITEDEEEYEALIVELATEPEKLAAVRAKLAKNRLEEPLFDTERYTQNFERGLTAAYDLYFEGKQPVDIWVTEDEV